VLAVALAADGRLALSGSDDGTARLWDVEAGTERCCCQGHTAGVAAVALPATADRR
jgi:WD40 repeat protein